VRRVGERRGEVEAVESRVFTEATEIIYRAFSPGCIRTVDL
jgi:hypothetical protein